jgi:hypothetical protein
MSDLGTVSILVDVRGQPVVRELAKDLNNVAAAEAKVSAATQKVMADLKRSRDIMANLKKTTDDTSASFQRFSAKELQQASQRMQGFQSALANTRRGMGQMGMATQQVGYQVGDFLVQVQSGTNPLVAFGQQATQLVGILPAFSGVLGMSVGKLIALSSGLGIAIPLLTAIGAVFMRTGEEADKGAEGVDKYKEALDSLKSAIQSTQAEINKLTFGTEDAAVSGARKAMMDAQAEVARLTASQTKIRGQFAPTEDEKAAIEAAVKNYRDLVINLNELTAKQRAFAEAQNMLNGGLSVAAGIQKGLVYDKQVELQNAKELVQSYISQIEVMGRTKAEAEALAEAASQAGVSAQQLSHIDFSNISTAATEALRLAGNLGISLDTASRLAALGPQGVGGNDPSGGTYSGRGALNQSDILGLRVAGSFGYTTPPKSGGGAARIKKETEAVKELTAAEKERQTILKSIESSLEDGFMSMVDGTKSVKSAFRSMARDIIKELYRVLVVQRLVGSISGAIGMFSGKSTGSLGLPFGLATGGSVMPGKSYLVGENGPELVIPRHSGTVVNANQTANAAGGSGGITVQNNISVTGSDAAMVRAEVAKMIPQITNATKAAVIDARLRGGQMKAAFS